MGRDYSGRGCLAHALGYWVVVGVGYAGGHGFEFLVQLVPTLRVGPVAIPTIYVKYFVVLPLLAILLWRVYPLYVRWLVRVGWLEEPGRRRDQAEEE